MRQKVYKNTIEFIELILVCIEPNIPSETPLGKTNFTVANGYQI